MLKQFISRIFMRRHFWRSVSFDEIAELYVSRLMTIFAMNIAAVFVALYMYKSGYSILIIVLYYLLVYLSRIPLAWAAATVAAYWGPKHGILIANILRIPSLLSLVMLEQWGIGALTLFGALTAMSATLYDLCYMIDFSKVKHDEHAGREIGTMQIIERLARVISPLIGGILAATFGPHATIMLASVIFLVAAIPLLRTAEPTETRMKLKLHEFPWRRARRTFIGQAVVGVDFVVSGLLWTLFMASVVFTSAGNATYAYLGALISVGVLSSLVAAWTYGHLIDKDKGKELIIAGAIGNWLVHLFRPFVTMPASATGVNITSEIATAAYAMSFTRVVFDVADRSSYRIGYLMIIEMMYNVGAVLACAVAAGAIWVWGTTFGMQITFVAAAFVLLLLIPARNFVSRV